MKVLELISEEDDIKMNKKKASYIEKTLKNNPNYCELFYNVIKSIEQDENVVLIDVISKEDSFLKVNEVEVLLGLSRPTLNMLFDSGKLEGMLTPQKHRRFSKKSVLKYLESIKSADLAKNKYNEEFEEDVEL